MIISASSLFLHHPSLDVDRPARGGECATRGGGRSGQRGGGPVQPPATVGEEAAAPTTMVFVTTTCLAQAEDASFTVSSPPSTAETDQNCDEGCQSQ
jgi:hypothetical protein